MTSYFLKYFFIIVMLILVAITTTSCSDETDPVIPPSEHFEPEGWVVRDAATKPILVVWQGVIQTTWNSTPIPDTLYAPLNALSDHYTVKFLDINKNIINPPTDADHEFGWLITNPAMLEVIRDNPADWAFHLKGKVNGTTTLELQVLHVGHVDVKTPKIPVIIREDTTAYGEPIGLRLSYGEDGTILATATDLSSTGTLVVQKDSLTDHIKFEFYDDQNRFYQPEYPLHSLGFTVANPTIAKILPEAGEPWVIRVKGLATGLTTITFKLVVSGVAEFVSFPINVNVQ
ncbi:MAG: hypothetical protein Q8M94_01955 [Ignavibacteria bacterium]|nr:hypothetical protein [Ignavibacteria bacterium]